MSHLQFGAPGKVRVSNHVERRGGAEPASVGAGDGREGGEDANGLVEGKAASITI